LKQSAPDHFSQMYALILSDDYERGYYSKKLFQLFSHFEPQLKYENFKKEGAISLSQGSLFAESRLIVIDQIDKMKKSELEQLSSELLNLDSQVKVILTGSVLPEAIYSKAKRDLVCLDLKFEKPWDRKTRIIQELIKIARQMQKTLDSEGANFLIEQCGLDFAALKNEIEKICCYIGNETLITLSHIRKLGSYSKEQNFWTIAEEFVWKRNSQTPSFKDLSAFLGIVGQIRYHLYVGIEICDKLAKGEAVNVKNLRPKQVEKFTTQARKLGSPYFIHKLRTLFELELMAKTHSINPSVLWDLLVVKSSS